MGSLTVFVALTWMVFTVLISSQAAPVTEFFGPPQTIEGDSNMDYPNIDPPKKVNEMERFHRTYKNGTVEFKMALSNGHVQYQRISSKVVDGDKVQVYEGYISEQYKDGRYGTRYYAADENGYRSSSVIVENEPPQLPTSGPYSSSFPRNIQNELSPLNDDNTQTKPKTLTDNLAELENDLEEEQLSNLNLGSNTANENSIPTTESEILKHLENEAISDTKLIEEEAVTQNFKEVQTELPLNLDLPLSTELPSISESENNFSKVSEEPESSTLPALEESSSIGIAVESSTDLPINEANNSADKLNESSGLPTQSNEEELLVGRSLHPSTTSEILSEVVEDVRVPYEERIDVVTPTVHETSFDNEVQEPSTGVPEILIDKLKTDNEISVPQEDVESHLATVSPADVSSNSSDEIVKALTEQPSLEIIEDRSTENIASAETEPNSNLPISSLAPETEDKSTDINEFPTEKLNNGEVKTEDAVVLREDIFSNAEVKIEKVFEEVSEAITGTFLNDEVTLTEQPATLKNEDQAISTEIPESNEFKTEAGTSAVSTLPLEDIGSELTTLSASDHISKSSAEEEEVTKVLTEQSSLEIIDNTTTERISSENKSNFDLSPSSIGPEIKNEVRTDVPLEEESSNVNDEASREVPNEPENIDNSEKNGRSIDFSTELPLPEINSTTSTVEGSGSEEENNNSDTSIISEINEETTNKIEINTEQPESNEDVNIVTTAGAITEQEVVLSTQKNDGLEAVSSESNNDNNTEANSITQALTSSEENSSEENKDKSTEDDSSTELPDESIEEKHNTASIIEYSTEAEVLSTTEETEAKTSDVEVEFYPPVIHF